MAKYFECHCCGAVSRRMPIDLLCSACTTLAGLVKVLDPNPPPPRGIWDDFGGCLDDPVTRDGRQALEQKLDAIFAEVTDRYGSETVRVRIASRGLNDWAKWQYEAWLAKREDRDPPAEPSLFKAMRDAWAARKLQGLGGRA